MSGKVGLIVLGSQEERHGLLPEDIDTKLAAHVALKAAALTGAKLVGIINSATEHEYIKHGRHTHKVVVIQDLASIVENAIERLGISRFVIVNGHGGNKPIVNYLPEIEKNLEAKIKFNSKVIEFEGAHAASGECSMAAAAELADPKDLAGQDDFERFPEVGFVGMKEAHVNEKLRELACETEKGGVIIDVSLGQQLLEKAVDDVVNTINRI